MLVEDQGLETSKDRKEENDPVPLEPPPSSDRQNINGLAGPETEDRMSS